MGRSTSRPAFSPTRSLVIALMVTLVAAAGCSSNVPEPAEARTGSSSIPDDSLAKATFAGGCFWCMERPFEELDGVRSVVSGFAGGEQPNPTYDRVSAGKTDYAEAVQVTYNPRQVSYRHLMEVYWRQIDPTDGGGQFADRGEQYRAAIYYRTPQQKAVAHWSKKNLARTGPFDEPIVTPIEPATNFYPAGDYHQNFYRTHSKRYHEYRMASGRGPFLRRVWGDRPVIEAYKDFEKPPDRQLREQLTPMQYKVTQQDGTEPPFANKYVDNKRAGLYVDVVSGEPLFSSTDKFHSGTGWPSFTRPLEPALVVERPAGDHFEVRSRFADSHLGDIFHDGPPPTHIRYCLDSAALRFVPRQRLEAEGYGRYAGLFE